MTKSIEIISLTILLMFTRRVLGISATQNIILQSKIVAGGLQCIKNNPLSLDEIKAFRSQMLPDSDNAKCFAACLFKKIGIMDDMGKLSQAGAVESAKKVFNDEQHLKKVEDLIGQCSSVNEGTKADGQKGCDRAKLAFSCLAENAPKYGFNLTF